MISGLPTRLAQRTNSAEFKKFGHLLTWQGIAALAGATGLHGRTVQRSIRRLQATGHVAANLGGGRHRSNRYILALQSVAAFAHQNPGTDARVSDPKTLASASRNPGTGVAKPWHGCHPNLSIKEFNNLSSEPDTAPGEPRRALGALGSLPLGEKLRERIGPDKFQDWLGRGEAELVEQTATSVTIAVRDKFFASQLNSRFEADVLACLPGVLRVEFVVRQ